MPAELAHGTVVRAQHDRRFVGTHHLGARLVDDQPARSGQRGVLVETDNVEFPGNVAEPVDEIGEGVRVALKRLHQAGASAPKGGGFVERRVGRGDVVPLVFVRTVVGCSEE